MITKARIIDQPYSGLYQERIYDVPSPWNSQSWTWVKFENEDFTEWCGEFRGAPHAVALSKKYNTVLVLTSDYLFQMDCLSGDVIEYESQRLYKSLTVTPSGEFILAGDYTIEKIEANLRDKILLKSPIEMIDMITFTGWVNNTLSITCKEEMNWDNTFLLELDGETLELTSKDFI
ncbi:hypothetical protein CSV77_02970 [Sporosarcina sp. P16b]|uniref:hypothetical protein n=1 Tax=Sporosarcina sp. P16b TaxID=2048261 RepID=UPI000C1694B4|nr:hypothetical protein [Sporosarcina sp. P16b]PIC72186.1 hypothetical protein CSV77_02970 [Sporosarcina sp. P16b]